MSDARPPDQWAHLSITPIGSPKLFPNDRVSDISIVSAAVAKVGRPVQVRRAYDQVWATILGKLNEHEPVTIDGFGVFTADPVAGVVWTPDQPCIDKMSLPGPPPPVEVPVNLPTVAKPRLPGLRRVDGELIDAWLRTRGRLSELDIEETLFSPREARGWQPSTIEAARITLCTAARSLPAPLTEIGFEIVDGVRTYVPTLARQIVVEFAQTTLKTIESRMSPGMRKHALEIWPTENPGLHSCTWGRLTRWLPLLFDWLEYTQHRPRGTNPFLQINRGKPTWTPRKLWIDTRDVAQVLEYTASLRDSRAQAMIYVLANGMRLGEARRLRVDDVHFDSHEVWVYGKGSSVGPDAGPRVRSVPLLPWTEDALKEWFTHRAPASSPWVFTSPFYAPPAYEPRPVTKDFYRYVIAGVLQRVFPDKDDPRRHRITPHVMRHWYITTAHQRGVSVDRLMLTTGHRSMESLHTYLVSRPEQARDDVRAAARERWF